MKNNELKRLSRELQCEGFITKYYKDTVKLPNGKTAIYDFVGHNGAAAAVAVLDDGRLLMVSQYRNALDRFTIEIPAGGLEPGEPTIKAAAREVEEETGYTCGKYNRRQQQERKNRRCGASRLFEAVSRRFR